MMTEKTSLCDTPLDRMTKDAWGACNYYLTYLKNAVKEVIIKKGVIDLYPAGANKDAAQETFYRTKFHMIAILGEYDNAQQEAIKILKRQGERNTTATYDICVFPDSSQVVEQVYEMTCLK